MAVLGNALLIFCLRVTDVSMGTVRTIMIMRGMRKWAALIGFVEVSIWVVAISRVIGHIDNVWSVIGYSGGFAAGTLLGMWIEGKLALGNVDVRVISMTKGQEIALQIRQAGYGATQLQAEGQSGPVYIVNVVAPRKQVSEIMRLVNKVDATAFVTVEETRHVMRGHRRLAK
ncbi:MAG TPA: DUF2179 domain-containing protein [Chloroflexi bacterium]|nr:DUF2179 domain-containing protein [Chloroflexota bacterium]